MIEFEAWPKTPRLSNGGVTITEKIDGTNACVAILPKSDEDNEAISAGRALHVGWQDNNDHVLFVQSRKRLIWPGSDNAGFAQWAFQNATQLFDLLGTGRHFGEWWGQGIQRRYNMPHKVFSLFNYHKFSKIAQERQDWRSLAREIHMSVVPLLHVGRFSDVSIHETLSYLQVVGSVAAAEWGVQFDRPEGIVIRHRDLGGNLKAFIEDDETPKSLRVVNQVNGPVSGVVIQAVNGLKNVDLR